MDTNEHSVNEQDEQKSPLGERIRDQRKLLGLSQAEFAKKVGVHRRTQINYEKGERKPDTDYLQAIALAGVDVGYVLTGESEFRTIRTLQSVLSSLQTDLELCSRRFDEEWANAYAMALEDLLDFFEGRPDKAKGLHAIRCLLLKSPVVVLDTSDLEELLDRVEFAAEACGLKLTPSQKIRATFSLYKKTRVEGLRFADLEMVKAVIPRI